MLRAMFSQRSYHMELLLLVNPSPSICSPSNTHCASGRQYDTSSNVLNSLPFCRILWFVILCYNSQFEQLGRMNWWLSLVLGLFQALLWFANVGKVHSILTYDGDGSCCPRLVRDQFLVCFQVSMVRGGEGHDVNPFLNAPRP